MKRVIFFISLNISISGKISSLFIQERIKTMLGRKQSLKGDIVLADYGPEETFNESADIEWVNKVSANSKMYV